MDNNMQLLQEAAATAGWSAVNDTGSPALRHHKLSTQNSHQLLLPNADQYLSHSLSLFAHAIATAAADRAAAATAAAATAAADRSCFHPPAVRYKTALLYSSATSSCKAVQKKPCVRARGIAWPALGSTYVLQQHQLGMMPKQSLRLAAQ
jgi:hypothetical protein